MKGLTEDGDDDKIFKNVLAHSLERKYRFHHHHGGSTNKRKWYKRGV
jgi:hypothetical protein